MNEDALYGLGSIDDKSLLGIEAIKVAANQLKIAKQPLLFYEPAEKPWAFYTHFMAGKGLDIITYAEGKRIEHEYYRQQAKTPLTRNGKGKELPDRKEDKKRPTGMDESEHH